MDSYLSTTFDVYFGEKPFNGRTQRAPKSSQNDLERYKTKGTSYMLSDLDIDISRSLKVKCNHTNGLPHI